jgi:hypothetical protein
MTRKLTTLFAAAAILASLGTATVVLGEENTPSPTNMTGQMSADQMSPMVEHCNRMMESMTTTAPDEKAPESHQD